MEERLNYLYAQLKQLANGNKALCFSAACKLGYYEGTELETYSISLFEVDDRPFLISCAFESFDKCLEAINAYKVENGL